MTDLTPDRVPVLWVSSKQMPNLVSGGYVAARTQDEGNFDTPLYAAPPPSVPVGREQIISAMSIELEKAGKFSTVDALVWATRLYEAALSSAPSAAPSPVRQGEAVAWADPRDLNKAFFSVFCERTALYTSALYLAPPSREEGLREAAKPFAKLGDSISDEWADERRLEASDG